MHASKSLMAFAKAEEGKERDLSKTLVVYEWSFDS
jgi:hypothetical protein